MSRVPVTLSQALRLLGWGLGNPQDPIFRLGGAVLGALLCGHPVDGWLVMPALRRLERMEERGQFSDSQEDLVEVIAFVRSLR